MGCPCGGSTTTGTWAATNPATGEEKTFTTEIDAKVFAAKNKGTWRKVS